MAKTQDFVIAIAVVVITLLVAQRVVGLLGYPFVVIPKCELRRDLALKNPPLMGDDVMELQERMAQLGFYKGPVDGVYSGSIVFAVREFQRVRGLKPDGIVRDELWHALGEPRGSSASDSLNLDQFTNKNSLSKEKMLVEQKLLGVSEGELWIKIDTSSLTLSVFENGELVKRYPVAVGKSKTPTPVGEWKVVSKSSGWGGGFGTRWIGISVPWGIYGIHGTNKPWSIGTRASAGCIRMYNKNVEELFKLVRIGTPVKIVGSWSLSTVRSALKRGDSGQDVVYLQLRLKEEGFLKGVADSRFGPATEHAVKELQRFYGLVVDGQADSDVLYILGLK